MPFPFTDQTTVKKRPAVVISSNAYNTSRDNVTIMVVTRRLHQVNKPGEELVSDWQGAGLLKPSVFKPILATMRIIPTLQRGNAAWTLQRPNRD